MEAIISTLTDEQRVETLNSIYQKGISMPKEELAFGTDKLVYLKPFMGRLTDTANDLTSRIMVRQIVDDLLQDIVDEISATCSRKGNLKANKVAAEYGLQKLLVEDRSEFYSPRKVA